MIKSILFLLFFCLLLIITITWFIPYVFFFVFRRKKALKAYIKLITSSWSKLLLFTAGASVKVSGLENLPEEDTICFVSNHQSIADIVVIFGYLNKVVGFIAKKELSRIPILGFWMSIIYCIFLDRNNARKSVKTMQQGVENIKKGHSMVIFPEGTRSRGNKMNAFKKGSFKLALRADAIIVPLTLNNTYKLFEETGHVKAAAVSLTIHPPINSSLLSHEEKLELPQRVQSIVQSAILE